MDEEEKGSGKYAENFPPHLSRIDGKKTRDAFRAASLKDLRKDKKGRKWREKRELDEKTET